MDPDEQSRSGSHGLVFFEIRLEFRSSFAHDSSLAEVYIQPGGNRADATPALPYLYVHRIANLVHLPGLRRYEAWRAVAHRSAARANLSPISPIRGDGALVSNHLVCLVASESREAAEDGVSGSESFRV